MSQRKMLITGASGFIGSNLHKRLNELGLDFYSTDIINAPINLDIRKMDDWEKFFSTYLISDDLYITHLAARVQVAPSLKYPFEYLETNVYGTLNLLEAMRKHDVSNLFFASAATIYGTKMVDNACENTTINPDTPYGCSKYMAERAIELYCHRYGLNAISARMTFVYGPNQIERNIIQQILDSAISGEDFVVFGDGSHYRMPLFVDDVVDLIILCMEKRKTGFNLYCTAGQHPTSINEMMNIAQKYGAFRIERKESMFAFNQIINIEKIKHELGWVPKTSIEEGMKKCMEKRLGRKLE